MKKFFSFCVVVAAMFMTSCDSEIIHQHNAEENINSLFKQAQECPAMVEQCNETPFADMLKDGTDCLSCKAICLLYLRETCDEWVDTLGDDPTSESLTEDAMLVIETAHKQVAEPGSETKESTDKESTDSASVNE